MADVFYRQEEPSSLLVEKIEAFVRGDPVDPGEQLRIFSEPIDCLIDLDKNLLREVVRIVVIDHHLPHMPVNALLVCTHKQVNAVIPRIRVSDFA